jgi:hypothetical protein
MSTLRVVNQAEEHFLDLVLAVGYTLHLFKNDVAVADTLTEAGMTEATFTGYSSVALTGGAWTTTAGDPCAGAYAKRSFTSSADQAAQTIYGYYVTRTSDGKLEWLEKFDAAVTVQFNLDRIDVTPQITLADTAD